MAADQALNPESVNTCCAEWKKKYLKLQESRNALRQAVKLLEHRINDLEAQNVNLNKAYQEEQARVKIEKEEKLKESNARVSLESEVSSLKLEITTLQQKCCADAQEGNADVKVFQACISEREEEIKRLKELLEREKIRADCERKIAEKEKNKDAEARKLLEAEKNEPLEKGMRFAKIEAEKAEEYRLQQVHLGKEVTEAKTKLASEMLKFKEATKRFEAEKQKLLAEKRNAESEMAKAQERLEVEKQKASREKRRADAVMVKVEEQKKLAEDNWKRAMEEKRLADQMSRQLEEDKLTIEDLKQKIHELSSLRRPIEMSGVSPDISLNAESTKVKLLENCLKLEKLRAKHARKKFKLEASHRSILQHELGCLKLDFVQLFHRLDRLDASFSPVAGSIHDLTKSQNIPNMQKSNITRQVCNLDMSQMHSRAENELMKPCCISMDVCDPLRKSMRHTPVLTLSGGNYAESITGIDSKLEPLIRGSDRTKLQSSAVNSSTASFSDGQLMGSQERGALQVTASTKLAQENVHARPSMSNPSDRSVIEHKRKRERILDTVEYIANLSSEGKKLGMQAEDKLSDLHGLLYKEVDRSFEGEREMVSNLKDNLQAKSDRARKKRKKSHRAKADFYKDEKKRTEETKAEVCEDANVCRHTPCPESYTLGTTQACRGMKFDAPNNFDSMISFDEVDDGNFMKLLDLENAADEECYRRAMDVPLSPSLPEIETFDMDGLKPFLEEALHEDLLGQSDLFPSTRFDVIDVEINSNEQKLDVLTVYSNANHKLTQARKTDVKLPHMHTPENLRGTFVAESGIGSLHNQLPNLCFVFSDIVDNSSISRIFCATKNCIARCSLATQTDWALASILTAVKVEEMLLQKEKHSVLLTLLLFNFTMTTAMKFGKLWDGNSILCLDSYAEHICKVLTDAETRVLFLENFSLHELLCLIEDFLIEGKVIFKNIVPTETMSESDSRTNHFLDDVDTLSSEVAFSEQLVAGSIILASVCAATDHVGFISESSYNILRLCKWDSLTVLTILHIFAYLGGGKFFDLGNFGLTVTVLKSLVMFIEEGSVSSTTASCLPSINQLHTKLCDSVKCPFSEDAESIDMVTLLLLEKIKNCLLQPAERFGSSYFRFLSDNYNTGQWSNQEVVQCASSMNCDVPCCLKKHVICATESDVLINVTMCQLSDVLSLLELLANKMSWQWTDIKLVPQLLNMLDSCMVENFAIAIIVLLGQLGRLGVDAGGYEDRGVENLRCNLFSYLCRNCSMKVSPSLQIATATALFGLLPVNFETLLQSNFSLPTYSSKSVTDDAENLRKWLSALDKDQQDLLYGILRRTDVY